MMRAAGQPAPILLLPVLTQLGGIAWALALLLRRRLMFIKPHPARTLGLSDLRLRFQGCRAARHDNHIHIQL